jgi:hypothetical protein
MIHFKTGLGKKEVSQIQSIISDLVDTYGDFYLTKNNLRLMIKDNMDVLLDCLKKGDKIAIDDAGSGVAIITGYSDNSPRKYLKILTKDLKEIDALLKIVYWNVKEDLYCKLKNINPLKDVLLSGGFKFAGGRGKESLLLHKAIEQREPTRQNFSKDKDED